MFFRKKKKKTKTDLVECIAPFSDIYTYHLFRMGSLKILFNFCFLLIFQFWEVYQFCILK